MPKKTRTPRHACDRAHVAGDLTGLIDAIGLELEQSNAILDVLGNRLEDLAEGERHTGELRSLAVLAQIAREKNDLILEKALALHHARAATTGRAAR